MCNSDFEGQPGKRYLRHGSQPEERPLLHEMPMLQPFWAAGLSFSRGHFVVRVPYDVEQKGSVESAEAQCSRLAGHWKDTTTSTPSCIAWKAA